MPVALDYSISGEAGSGPPLLLVHAMGADLTFWNGCRQIWENEYQCLAVSLRGAGASPRAEQPLTMEAQAADLEALRAELGLERLVPVGCAVGAMVAATYAGRHPDRCAALVLSNPGFRTTPDGRAALKRRADTVRTEGIAAVSAQTVEAAFGPDGLPEQKQAFKAELERLDPASYAFTIEGMLDADISASLAAVTCPALVVAGEMDTLLSPADHAVHVKAALPDAEYISVPDGAHFLPYQKPKFFAPLVADFLRRSL